MRAAENGSAASLISPLQRLAIGNLSDELRALSTVLKPRARAVLPASHPGSMAK